MRPDFPPGSPEATALVPLWCRARCALDFPALGVGSADAAVLRSVSADFSAARRSDCVLYALRERLMLRAAGAYLAAEPSAALLDLGCGLDTALRRAGLAGAQRVYVDLPRVIALRRELIPPLPGETYVAADLASFAGSADTSDSAYTSGSADSGDTGTASGPLSSAPGPGVPAFIAMCGLLCHLAPEEVRALLSALARRFPGAGIAFDGVGPLTYRTGGRYGLRSSLTTRFLAGTGAFASLERVSRLPDEFDLLPASRRFKLAVLLRSGTLGFYSGRLRE